MADTWLAMLPTPTLGELGKPKKRLRNSGAVPGAALSWRCG